MTPPRRTSGPRPWDKHLNPVMQEARARSLWLRNQDGLLGSFWFSPNELEDEYRQGRYHSVAPDQWRTADPLERLAALKQRADTAKKELADFQTRLEKWRRDEIITTRERQEVVRELLADVAQHRDQQILNRKKDRT